MTASGDTSPPDSSGRWGGPFDACLTPWNGFEGLAGANLASCDVRDVAGSSPSPPTLLPRGLQ